MENTSKKNNDSSVYIEDEMKNAYMDYAMSVIIGRAIPDAKDGLKPVHRRILYAMYKEGLLHNKRYSKCAGVVGEVLKKYHPHGDTAVYDTLVRMAQPWSMRYPLIDGQGNFGSIDGDPPAAYRYTEAKMFRVSEDMLEDIEKETVGFIPNFDNSTEEPVNLPTRIPNLLINGSSGIAVGMATNIPPHNIGEVINGVIAVIDNENITIEELMKHIPGPDFPTAGFIHGTGGIISAYNTGRGLIQMRAKTSIETLKNDKVAIIIDELPYQVNKARLVEKIAYLVKNKKIEGISALRDESDRDGMRVVIELKRGETEPVILNKLYQHTQMQETFGVIMLAIIDSRPKVLNLKEILSFFVFHRKDVITKRTIFELKKAEEKAHILEGLKIAIDNIDEIIAIIRSSKSSADAAREMEKKFSIDAIQSKAILDMRLARLTAMERDKVLNDLDKLRKDIDRYNIILGSEEEKYKIIKMELNEIKEKYNDERRTKIIPREKDFIKEDFIVEEDTVVTISHRGYIKRNLLSLYKSQHRGGKGIIGMGTREEDFVEEVFIASTHSFILFFTNVGKVHWLKVYEIPPLGRTTKGASIANLLQLETDEKITAYIAVKEFNKDDFLVMATENGVVKKTSIIAYSNPRIGGIIALTLDDGDKLISVKLTDGEGNIFLGTKNGYSIMFKGDVIRTIGRTGRGVRGITLRKNDKIVGMEILTADLSVLTVTEKGYGKRTDTDHYRLQGRGGLGVINLKVKEKNGNVVGIKGVKNEDELMIITYGGQIIRLRVSEISNIGRSTQGVKLIGLESSDRVVGIATQGEKTNEEETELNKEETGLNLEETPIDQEEKDINQEELTSDEGEE